VAARTNSSFRKFKERVIYTGSGLQLYAVAICIFKRGGSAKVLLLTRSAHQKSLCKFVEYIEKCVRARRKYPVRKLYAHFSASDTGAWQSFISSGFRVEGIIERPYNDSDDVLVVAKNMSA